jgi:hypothetical protein
VLPGPRGGEGQGVYLNAALSHPNPPTDGTSMTLIMSDRHLHHASKPESLRIRIDRLAPLAADQIEAGLIWLAGHCPDIFDAVVHAALTWDDGQAWVPVAATS